LARLIPDTQSALFLHTLSASLFVAGLLAAARKGRSVVCPAHIQPDYLEEIEASSGTFLTDQDIDVPGAVKIGLADAECAASGASKSPTELDLVFYTSGVTGAPKAVFKRIAQLDAEANAIEALWGGSAGRVFATVSHQHIYGMLFRIFWPIVSGRSSADRAAEFWEQLSGRLGPGSTLVSSPAHLTRLAPLHAFAGSCPDRIFSSGAPLPYEAVRACETALGSRPIEVLGSTETGGIAWRQRHKNAALWTPLPSVEVTADETARLLVVSPFTGQTEPLATGDRVKLSEGGFQLEARADRIVKIEGKRVSLVRVEEVLTALPFVENASAVDLPARHGALGAVVQLTEAGRHELDTKGSFRLSRELRHLLSSRLSAAERPKQWRFARIPRNAQGKVVQAMVRAIFDPVDEHLLGRGQIGAADERSAEVALKLPASLLWFSGHFPGEPILPGISQVHIAVLWANRVWGWQPDGATITRLKFRHVLRPDDAVLLKLARNHANDSLKFAYHYRELVASEGVIGGAA
jgi:3-hydroxymyristoyl/3-hydroxydecanoyl-(acyl carrier protein) dehydratase